MNVFKNTRAKGKYYEDIASRFLVAKGYKSVAKNFTTRFGEIDLIFIKRSRKLLESNVINEVFTKPKPSKNSDDWIKNYNRQGSATDGTSHYLEKMLYRNESSALQDKPFIESELLFCEVRYRGTESFGGARASISKAKQYKLQQTAAIFIDKYNLSRYDCRFDILCLSGSSPKIKINWIKNAINYQY